VLAARLNRWKFFLVSLVVAATLGGALALIGWLSHVDILVRGAIFGAGQVLFVALVNKKVASGQWPWFSNETTG
jgi:hypothetical protein